jgi:hypothetical protein
MARVDLLLDKKNWLLVIFLIEGHMRNVESLRDNMPLIFIIANSCSLTHLLYCVFSTFLTISPPSISDHHRGNNHMENHLLYSRGASLILDGVNDDT